MPAHRTARDVRYPASRAYPAFVLPRGTPVTLVRGADGVKGDLWAVRDAKVVMDLTGNTHDPEHRHTWVPADAVEAVEDAPCSLCGGRKGMVWGSHPDDPGGNGGVEEWVDCPACAGTADLSGGPAVSVGAAPRSGVGRPAP